MHKGTPKKTFIIAEIGVNHNGDLDLAQQLIRAAKDAGANAVKFQSFNADDLVKKGTNKAAYQSKNTHFSDQYEMLKSLELSHEAHKTLFKYCETLNIEFMSTPFDEKALNMLMSLGMKRIKIPSGDITHHPFLKKCTAFGKPIILSTGMSTLDEVKTAIALLIESFAKYGFDAKKEKLLSVLHCTSNYPTPLNEVNLSAMITMGRHLELPFGYSDHTLGTLIAPVAVSMGATIIEKHITLDHKMPGPDHKASLEPDEFKNMVDNIHAIENALGSTEKTPNPSELATRDLVRRSLFTSKPLQKDHKIKADDIKIIRPGTGLAPSMLDEIIGSTLNHALDAHHMLSLNDITRKDKPINA